MLGVDHRTVAASLAGEELSRRVREALERLLLARGARLLPGNGRRWMR